MGAAIDILAFAQGGGREARVYAAITLHVISFWTGPSRNGKRRTSQHLHYPSAWTYQFQYLGPAWWGQPSERA